MRRSAKAHLISTIGAWALKPLHTRTHLLFQIIIRFNIKCVAFFFSLNLFFLSITIFFFWFLFLFQRSEHGMTTGGVVEGSKDFEPHSVGWQSMEENEERRTTRR